MAVGDWPGSTSSHSTRHLEPTYSRKIAMPNRQEVLVSAIPLALRVERGAGTGHLRVVVEGFDPVELAPDQRLVLRPQGHGLVVERERSEQ
jgi:hypothetical protein